MREAIESTLGPHVAADAERGILGICITSPAAAQRCLERLSLDDFEVAVCRQAWKTLTTIARSGQVADLVIMSDQPGAPTRLELTDLTKSFPSTAHLGTYVDAVREARRKRDLRTASLVALAGLRDGLSAKQVEAGLEGVVGDSETLSQSRQSVAVGDVVDEVLADIRRRGTTGILPGTSTGIRALDDITAGLHDGELIVLGARPSVGKTTFALNLASEVIAQELGVAFYSLEMNTKQLVQNVLAFRAQIDTAALRTGNTQIEEDARLETEANELRDVAWWINDTPGLTPNTIRTDARRLHREHGLGLVIVDYLQLMESAKYRKGDSRERDVARFSRQLKLLARELDCPVLALSQLNRQSEQRADGRPRLSDLRESGAVEQDSDCVLLLHRERDEPDKLELIVAKNRNGPVGVVPISFDRRTLRFTDRRIDHAKA